jgi:hypothetical protein
MMLVGRLTDIEPVEEIGVSVGVVMPSGAWSTRHSGHIVIEMAGEYVLVTLRDIPLSEEGVHRFCLALSGQTPVFVDVPVLRASAALASEVLQ